MKKKRPYQTFGREIFSRPTYVTRRREDYCYYFGREVKGMESERWKLRSLFLRGTQSCKCQRFPSPDRVPTRFLPIVNDLPSFGVRTGSPVPRLDPSRRGRRPEKVRESKLIFSINLSHLYSRSGISVLCSSPCKLN